MVEESWPSAKASLTSIETSAREPILKLKLKKENNNNNNNNNNEERGRAPSGVATKGAPEAGGSHRPVRGASLRLRAKRRSFEGEIEGDLSDSHDECESPRKRFLSGATGKSGKLGPRYKGEDMLRFPGYVSVCPDTVHEEEVTLEWMASGAFDRPFRLLGCSTERLQTYRKMNDVDYIRDNVGHDAEVRTIDVKTQNDGPKMTLEEWCDYWKYKTQTSRAKPHNNDFGAFDRSLHHMMSDLAAVPKHGKRSLNVVSLSLANTPLETDLEAPTIVQQSDLVRLFWPKHDTVRKPKAELYALMSPAKCYTDWHVDFGGSSVWYNVVRGKKFFALAPPTEHNLKSFAAWANSDKQEKVNLLVYLKDPVLYELKAGDTMIIPGGWPHAVYTPSDSIAVGGNFLHPFNLGLQLEVWRLEDAIGVPMSCRFPAFKSLMWYIAKNITTLGMGPHSQPREEDSPDTDVRMAENGAPASDIPVLKLKVKQAGVGETNGLRIKLPKSPETRTKESSFGALQMAKTARAIKLLLAQSKTDPKGGLGTLLTLLTQWLGSHGAQASVPLDVTAPREVLEELEILLGALKILPGGEQGRAPLTDYATAKLEEPHFKESAENQSLQVNLHHKLLIGTNGYHKNGAGNGAGGARANGYEGHREKGQIPKKFGSSGTPNGCNANGAFGNGLGPTKKMKKTNSVRDRLKKKLGMR